MNTKLTRKQANEKASELYEIKSELEDLLGKARDIMRGTGMIGRRAESYWINNIDGCLDNRGCMVTLQDTIDELESDENEDVEDFKSDPEACPECGCKPGEEYTYNCSTCQATEAELNPDS